MGLSTNFLHKNEALHTNPDVDCEAASLSRCLSLKTYHLLPITLSRVNPSAAQESVQSRLPPAVY